MIAKLRKHGRFRCFSWCWWGSAALTSSLAYLLLLLLVENSLFKKKGQCYAHDGRADNKSCPSRTTVVPITGSMWSYYPHDENDRVDNTRCRSRTMVVPITEPIWRCYPHDEKISELMCLKSLSCEIKFLLMTTDCK